MKPFYTLISNNTSFNPAKYLLLLDIDLTNICAVCKIWKIYLPGWRNW